MTEQTCKTETTTRSTSVGSPTARTAIPTPRVNGVKTTCYGNVDTTMHQ
jgi:hypothetical protein